MPRTLFDSSILASTQDSLDFITNVLQSSTEYSIIGKVAGCHSRSVDCQLY